MTCNKEVFSILFLNTPRIQENQKRPDMNATHHLLMQFNGVCLVAENVKILRKLQQTLVKGLLSGKPSLQNF
jgi:hypothetical protein